MAKLEAPSSNLEAVQRVTRRIDAIGEQHPGVFMGLSWYYIRLIWLAGIGWAMDSMETFVFIYCSQLIFADIPVSVNQQAFLGGSVFIGSFVGSFLFGSLMDIYGRRPMFMITLVLFLVGLALCATSWNITSLTVFRMLSGVGLGGELPVASTLVQELAPQKCRAKIIVLLESFWAIGGMIAVWLAFGVAPKIGWRETFYLCLIPVVWSAVIRFMIPESPKWLASVGRYEEAVAIVEKMERSHGLTHHEESETTDAQPLKNIDVADSNAGLPMARVVLPTFVVPESHAGRIAMLFRSPFVTRTAVLWTLWCGISLSYYAIYIYLPNLVGKKGYNINASWKDMLVIMAFQLPGYFAAAALVEYIGRRITLVVFLTGSFGAALALGYVEATRWPVMISGSVLSFFLLGAWGCVYAYTPENYPTAIRGIGAAYPAGFSRIGAFAGPYLVPYMDTTWKMSISAIMWTFGGVLMFISIVVLVFGYEPIGKNVEDVNDGNVASHQEYEAAVDRA